MDLPLTRRSYRIAVAFILSLCLCADVARADSNNGKATAAPDGVRHEIRAALRFDPDSPYTKSDGKDFKAELSATIQISDHAPDADFFGVEVADFSLVAPGDTEPAQLVWADRKCHHDRGLPKVTIVKITGTITADGSSSAISAAPRRLGRRLSDDEITVRKEFSYFQKGTTDVLAIRATTKASGLVMDIDLTATPCRLEAGVVPLR